MDTVGILSSRIFEICDEDKDGRINFRDFILYIDKVINGDEDEKA